MKYQNLNVFWQVWLIVVVSVLTLFALCKIGGNMFDRAPSKPVVGIDSSDGVRGCNSQGGTVVAEHGEYKECKFRNTK